MSFLKNYYKYTLLLLALNGLIACKNTEEKIPPKDLLSEQEMGRVLADVLLIQNYLAVSASPNYLNLEISSYPLINEKYQLTDSQAYYSYQYYLTDPETFNRILLVTKDTLEQINKKFTTTPVE